MTLDEHPASFTTIRGEVKAGLGGEKNGWIFFGRMGEKQVKKS